MPSQPAWRTSALWRELEQRTAAEPLLRRAADALDRMEEVLRAGGTSPLDFTLHDAEHAWRVGERMAEILGSGLNACSNEDIFLLLLSAYGHDIGMTPPASKISDIFLLLSTGERGRLQDEDINWLQRWLDDEHGGVMPPPPGSRASARDLRRARLLTTHYARHRHNDWSADWLRRELSARAADDQPYGGWLDDLITVCRSHHEGYEELASDRFDPRIVTSGQVVNLRYCACLLRVADVVEFDPERTPDVVFRHRGISANSEIYWHKDHRIGFKLVEGRLLLDARPTSAAVHKAILDTVEMVQQELLTCRRLDDSPGFDRYPGMPVPLEHRWPLEASAHVQIRPADARYEYVEGSFKPDVDRLLELLGGLELYGSRLVAIRELLQNAFDAVRTRVARERLDRQLDASAAQALAATYSVRLDLYTEGADTVLACRDMGVGMTKEALLQQFLVSGAGPRHADLDLERRCRAKGFSVGRTGQFGIGVLSYFMIASRLVVETRATDSADGWRFEIGGRGDFGELRRAPGMAPGTTVTLTLNDTFASPSIAELASTIDVYLNDILSRLPCRFEANLHGSAREQPAGWVTSLEPLLRNATAAWSDSKPRRHVRGVPGELMSHAERQARADAEAAHAALVEQYRASLNWMPTSTSLRGDVECRAYIPWVNTVWGPCLTFLTPPGVASDIAAIDPPRPIIAAWHGMNVTTLIYDDEEIERNAVAPLFLNFISSDVARPAVHRNVLTLTDRGLEAVHEAVKWAATERERLVEGNQDLCTTMVNRAVIGGGFEPTDRLEWPRRHDGNPDARALEPFKFPTATDGLRASADTTRYAWHGKPVESVSGLSAQLTPGSGTSYEWRHDRTFPPSHMLVLDRAEDEYFPGSAAARLAVPVWGHDTRSEVHSRVCAVGALADFPPGWNRVYAVREERAYTSGVVLNRQNPLTEFIAPDSWNYVLERVRVDRNPLAHPDLIDSVSRAVSWLGWILATNDGLEILDAAIAQSRDFARRLAETLTTANGHATVVVGHSEGNWGTTFVELTSAGLDDVTADFANGAVPDDWRLTESYARSRQHGDHSL